MKNRRSYLFPVATWKIRLELYSPPDHNDITISWNSFKWERNIKKEKLSLTYFHTSSHVEDKARAIFFSKNIYFILTRSMYEHSKNCAWYFHVSTTVRYSEVQFEKPLQEGLQRNESISGLSGQCSDHSSHALREMRIGSGQCSDSFRVKTQFPSAQLCKSFWRRVLGSFRSHDWELSVSMGTITE